jgi:hypothetical protein
MLKSLHMAPAGQSLLYQAYGLAILSATLLPELRACGEDAPPQVTISVGPIARELPGRTGGGVLFDVSPGKFLLQMDGVARYLVADGTGITIDAAAGADEDSVRLFLWGSVFGALLHQRGLLPLHASAIETPKGAVLFAGSSTRGKSALAAAFHARGYRVIADEICAIKAAASPGAEAIPAIPRLLLWPDVIDQSGLWGPGVRPARANLGKYHVPLETRFASAPSPVHAVYFLVVDNGSEYNISPVSGRDKFVHLTDLTFRWQFLSGGMCDEGEHFHRVAAVARDIRMWRLERPIDRPLQETADRLEKDFMR